MRAAIRGKPLRRKAVATWKKMRLLGLEPKTYGLKVRCSTD
jgi:hypothetical protein